LRNRYNSYFIILLLLISAASCARKTAEVDMTGADPGVIVEKVGLLESGVRSVKGLARVRIETASDKVSYTQVTVAEKPDLIRLEALNPFGSTVGFISSDGRHTYIISSGEKDVYDAREEFDLSYVYPGLDIRITAESLVNLVMGRLPYRIYESDSKPAVAADAGLIKLTWKNGSDGGESTLWVNNENYRVEKAEFPLGNGGRATLLYEYFDGLVDGHYFPRKIDFDTGGLSITIVYEPDVELNGGVDRALFTPQAAIENSGAQNYN
jgi:outer membrane lipoprotein-sorting protein